MPNCPEEFVHSRDRCFYFTCRLLWKTLGMNTFLACKLNPKGVPSCRKPFLWWIKFLHLFHSKPPPSVSGNFLFWEVSNWLTPTSAHWKLDSVPLKILEVDTYILSFYFHIKYVSSFQTQLPPCTRSCNSYISVEYRK